VDKAPEHSVPSTIHDKVKSIWLIAYRLAGRKADLWVILRDDARMVTLKNAVWEREREKRVFVELCDERSILKAHTFFFFVKTSPCKIVALVRIFFQNNRIYLIFLTFTQEKQSYPLRVSLKRKEVFIVTIYCVIKRRLRLNIVHESQNFQIIALVLFHNCKS